MVSMSNVVVLGAGLSGLGLARSFPGVRIFEAQSHPGGRAYSYPVDGVYFDQGAHISHTKKADFLELIYKQAGDVHQIEPSIVSNFWHQLWLTYPVQNHLNELPLDKRITALTDLIMAHINREHEQNANYAEWCLSQYGQYLTQHFYRVFTEKYWRFDMEDLATDWLGGRLIPSVIANIIHGAFSSQKEKQASFAKFHYPTQGGFFSFFKALYDDIDVRYNERAVQLDVDSKEIIFESGRKDHYEILASSIPLPDIVAAIKEVPASIADAAALLRYTKLLCVNMIVRRPGISKNHWCYIYDHEINPARVSFPSNLSPNSITNDISTLQAEIFRRDDEDWDIDSLIGITVEQMAKLFKFDVNRELVSATPFVIPCAYVISDLNREASVTHILSWLREKDIFCMGLYGKWKYIWSDVAYYSGVETAKEIRGLICQG